MRWRMGDTSNLTHLGGLFNDASRPNCKIKDVVIDGTSVPTIGIVDKEQLVNDTDEPLELTISYGGREGSEHIRSAAPPWVLFDVPMERVLAAHGSGADVADEKEGTGGSLEYAAEAPKRPQAKESYTHSVTRESIEYSKAEMQTELPTQAMVDFNVRVAQSHTAMPLSELVHVSPPTPMRTKAAALIARFLNGTSFKTDGDGIKWVKAGARGNELHISTKFCCGFEGYGNVHELNKRPKQQRNHTLRLRNYEGKSTDPGYLWPEMVAMRNALVKDGLGIGIPGFNLDTFAEKRFGAAFVIAYVYMIEQMRGDIAAIRGSCGPLADSHDVDTFNKSSAFGWHPDNHTEEDNPPGPYVEHSAVCQCSPGETSMTVAGLPESVYLGVGSIVIFPAWALHRTSKRGKGPSMWKLAGFFEP
eukprot:7391814-Prymnesium_polylepis.1